MRAKFQLEDVDTQEATMTLTTTIREWKALKELLDGNTTLPAAEFRGLVSNLIRKATLSFEMATKAG